MKKVLLFLAITLNCMVNAYSQKIRFSDTINSWTVLSGCTCDVGIYRPVFSYGRDTIMNGLRYTYLSPKGDGYFSLAVGWIREDTVAGKVLFRGIGHNTGPLGGDTVERILYDYNWKLGDTIRVDLNTFHSKHFIQQIDSTLIDGVYHKVWFVMAMSGPGITYSGRYVVIEGIGCTSDPFYPAYPHIFEEYQIMYCFTQKGKPRAYLSPAINWQGVKFNNSCSLSVDEASPVVKAESVVVPNPAHKDAVIQLKSAIEHGELKVYNCVGILVAKIELHGLLVIPLPQEIRQPGMYFYLISNDLNDNFLRGRFIME